MKDRNIYWVTAGSKLWPFEVTDLSPPRFLARILSEPSWKAPLHKVSSWLEFELEQSASIEYKEAEQQPGSCWKWRPCFLIQMSWRSFRLLGQVAAGQQPIENVHHSHHCWVKMWKLFSFFPSPWWTETRRKSCPSCSVVSSTLYAPSCTRWDGYLLVCFLS